MPQRPDPSGPRSVGRSLCYTEIHQRPVLPLAHRRAVTHGRQCLVPDGVAGSAGIIEVSAHVAAPVLALARLNLRALTLGQAEITAANIINPNAGAIATVHGMNASDTALPDSTAAHR